MKNRDVEPIHEIRDALVPHIELLRIKLTAVQQQTKHGLEDIVVMKLGAERIRDLLALGRPGARC